MPFFGQHINILIVYFIYGLAFFSMGIALTLEGYRSPMLAERRLLKPLAAFGLLHGAHEWFEIFLLHATFLGAPFPATVEWLRVGWLAISFVPLVVFGIMGVNLLIKKRFFEYYVSILLLVIFIIFSYFLAQDSYVMTDALSRYILAIPGGILAALALFSRATRVEAAGRKQLSARFRWAAAGFGTYGLSQIFVPQADLLLGNILYSGLFLEFTGLPIQVVRAGAALFITINLIGAIQQVEREREQQLRTAQKDKLEAMERVQQELLNRETLRQELLRHIVIAQEEERARISRELHDETAQILTALSLDLASLKDISKKQPKVSDIIDRLQNLCRDMSHGIYRLVNDLRPAQLDDLGLVPALKYLCDQCSHLGLRVSLDISGNQKRLDPLVETVLFRVAQEGLSNVSRHANINQASISLAYCDGKVIMNVSDKGIGFDPEERLIPPHGWGLEGMRERAESIGGVLVIRSEPGKGTVVEISIPIIQEDVMKEQTHGK
jgi:signal transduction histidine kinase